jgi:hypothetical protein
MLARLGLAIVGLAQGEVGIWGELSPRGFYNRFPDLFGQHWVRPLGPFNEHLLRDYASAELGLAVLLLGAAVWFDRRLVLLAAAAFLVGTAPHLAYHLTTTDMLSAGANVASLGAFVVELAIVAAVLVLEIRKEPLR